MMLQSLLPQSPINPTTTTTTTTTTTSSETPPTISKRSSSPTSSSSPRPLKHPNLNTTNSPEIESRVLHLLTLLLQCAESVSLDNLSDALSLLPEITSLSSPFGSSPERVAAYFSDALRARIFSSYLSSYSPLPLKSQTLTLTQTTQRSFHLLNSLTPLIKFSHFTSNQAIFQSVAAFSRLHIIDFDIMQGLQWPGLFHILASRPRPIESLRITGIGPDSDLLAATGRRLSDFAASLNLPFQFTPLEGKIADVAADFAVLRRRDPLEATVVHWTQHCLYDVTGSDLAAARILSLLRPRLITVVEQDLGNGGNNGGFLGRFVEALHYYSALFDAIGDGGGEGEERWEVERGVLGGEIRNIVAVGGPKRTGEVRVVKWGDELRRSGFRQVSLGGSPATQASLLLGMVPWKGYTLAEDGGRLKLGWKDLSLLTASAWRPANVAGEEGDDDGGEEEWERGEGFGCEIKLK